MANTTIALRSSGTAAATPSLGVLANGELSINYADGIIYYKTASNTLGSIRTTQPAGLTTEIQFNDAGSFGSNASLTFNKTISTLNVTNINVATSLTATSITTGSGVGGTIAGANVIYSNVFVANSGGYIQFADGSKQYTANASNISNNQILASLQAVSSTANITFDYVATANNGQGFNFKVGDDTWIGDVNLADTLSIRGQQNSANAYILFGSANANTLGRAGTGPLTYTGAFTATGILSGSEISATQSSGNEGGQINLALAATNTTLNSSVAIDIFQNKLRIFETGGTNRGVFIDMANSAAAGVGTDLLNPTATPDTVARATANAAFDKANSANVLAQAAYNQANTDYTTISATAGVYGNASFIPVTTLTANGRVSSITNTAISIDTGAIASGTLAVARGGTGVTTSTGTGAVVLNTAPTLSTPTVDRVDWPSSGYAPPSLTTRSSGTKLTLYPSLSSTSVDYAFGIDGGTLWSSIPAANSSYSFKWYGGESEITSLRGDGLFTTLTANITSTTASTSNTTGALKVAGGIGVKGNVSAYGINFADGTIQTTAASGGASIGDVLALAIALG